MLKTELSTSVLRTESLRTGMTESDMRPASRARWTPPTFDSSAAAWLAEGAADVDVCLSSRVRFMRNVAGFRFPHHATAIELREVVGRVAEAANASRTDWNVYRGLAPGERDALVAERLISPDFETGVEGRAVLLDPDKRLSIMVNEEDHLRFQALTPGWSIRSAEQAVSEVVAEFGSRLDYAWSPRFGYLSSSPFNCGEGVRMSAMFHLIALAQSKRLPTVLKALAVQKVVARGLFGEASRAIGAMLQLSVTSADVASILGAGEYLLKEEREARALLGKEVLLRKFEEARTFAIASRTISLADALRVLGWLRWAAAEGVAGAPSSPRVVDGWLTLLAPRTGAEESSAARMRAVLIREFVELGS